MPSPLPCPACGADLGPRPAACPACALPLAGPVAGRLYVVDTTLRALGAERLDLLGRLRAGQTGPSSPAPAPLWASAGPGSSPAPMPWTGQHVLLGLGALLVTLAAIVFVAVAWSVLGTGGQLAVLVGVTVAAGAGARLAGDRGLTQTGEALAALSGALAVIDVVAARTLGLVPPDAVGGPAYVAGAAAVLTLALGGGSWLTPRSAVYPALAVVAASVPVLALAGGADLPFPGLLAVALVQAGLSVAVAGTGRNAVDERVAVARGTALVCGAGLAVVVGSLALGLVLANGDDAPGATAVALVLAVVTAGAAGLERRWRAAAWPGAVYGGLVLALAAPAVLDGAAGSSGLVLVGVAAALAVAVAADTRYREAVAGALTAYAIALLQCDETQAALVLGATAVLAAGRLVLADRLPRTWAVAGASAAGALGAALAAVGASPTTAALFMAGAAAGLVATAAANRADGRIEAVLGAESAIAGLVAAGCAADGSPAGQAGIAFVLAGVTLLYALLPRRGPLAVAGLLLAATGSWILLADAGVEQVEAYTLPLAAGAALLGLALDRRQPGTSSWLTGGPAVVVALAPSAMAAIADGDTGYRALVLAVAGLAAVAAVGARLQSVLVVATAAAVGLAFALAGPSVAALPRWLTLGTLGLALLAAGATYEAGLHRLRSAGRWVDALR